MAQVSAAILLMGFFQVNTVHAAEWKVLHFICDHLYSNTALDYITSLTCSQNLLQLTEVNVQRENCQQVNLHKTQFKCSN